MSMKVRDFDAVDHQVNTDTIGATETQLVKMQLGDPGASEGPVSSSNPMPVSGSVIEWALRRMARLLGGFSFDTTSQLRVIPATHAVTISSGTVTTVTTCGTVTTGNMGMGDMGKPASSMMCTRQSFACGLGRNFVRS
jgi:hypothetical protein